MNQEISSRLIPDRTLLQQFVDNQDESAFAELVVRYHNLVMSVCLRVLRKPSDAEEAYQATFLVLAKRAASIRWTEWIGSWLYETAFRTAKQHRRSQRKTQQHVSSSATSHSVSIVEELESNDVSPERQALLAELGTILDEEIAKLPTKFREPLILQLFEGLDRQEIADRLGLSLGAIKDRLERGRDMLRLRLTSKGITLSMATIVTWLSFQSTGSAAVGPIVQSTATAATSFASGSAISSMVSSSTLALANGMVSLYMISKTKMVGVGLLMVSCVAIAAFAMIQDSPDRFQKAIRGYIQSVENHSDNRSITLLLDEYEVNLKLPVSKDASVRQAYAQGRFQDLTPGTYVGLRLMEDHQTVIEIHALGRTEQVHVLAIDARSSPSLSSTTLEIIDDDDSEVARVKKTVEFSLGALLRIGGLPANLDHIQPGAKGQIEYGPSSNRIHAMEIQPAEGTIVEGKVLEYLSDSNIVRVEVERDDVWKSEEWLVGESTIVQCMNEAIDATSMQSGQTFVARVTGNSSPVLEAICLQRLDPDDD